MTVSTAKPESPMSVTEAMEVLSTGSPRQDDATSQVEDIFVLATAAGCSRFVSLVSQKYSGEIGDLPSNNDPRIARAAAALQGSTPPDCLAKELLLIRKFIRASGCYDAAESFRSTLPVIWR